ncbi:MAG: rod shape-determining protein MreC [Alphaproteobacteria bacterium]|nr:rod shape-determining protein MreC [Alphaproteobacteria bacterium]
MKRRKSLFLHLSNIRLLAKKFALVLLFLSAFALMLVNKTDTAIIEKTSSWATDVISPIVDILVVPARSIAGVYDYLKELKQIHTENDSLRKENAYLLQIKDKALALEVENRILAGMLNYIVPPEAKFVTARVVAEEGDAFSHSIVAYTGDNSNIRKGQVVLSDRGVVGRIEQVGRFYSKIILITDINSKIPVMVERTRVRGILTGNNTPTPKMDFIPLEAELTVGDRVVTSGVAGVFPVGLPIGKISSIEKNNVKITTFTNLERLEYVRIVDFGLLEQQ